MTEAELETYIEHACLVRGILRFHVRDSRGMTPGFPDDVLIGTHGLLWRECKGSDGVLSPAQRRVGRMLAKLGEDWAVWGPADLYKGRIISELEEIA